MKGDANSGNPSISADGANVAFDSFATNLDPLDVNEFSDIFVKEVGVGSVCTIAGTEGGDILRGTSGDDVICGLGGDDRIAARGGNDLVFGGPGADVLGGGPGSDDLQGEGGNDVLNARDGVGGNDTANGGVNVDRCRVDPCDVVIACP